MKRHCEISHPLTLMTVMQNGHSSPLYRSQNKVLEFFQQRRWLVLIVLMVLAACTNNSGGFWTSANNDQSLAAVTAPDPVNMRLAEAAERASKALEDMSLVEQARTPVDTTPPVFADAPEELKQLVTITWHGPVEGVASLLADVAGYSFAVIGMPPPTPVVISVEATERPVIEILRSIGLQMGRHANLTVNVDKRVVELRYVSTAPL